MYLAPVATDNIILACVRCNAKHDPPTIRLARPGLFSLRLLPFLLGFSLSFLRFSFLLSFRLLLSMGLPLPPSLALLLGLSKCLTRLFPFLLGLSLSSLCFSFLLSFRLLLSMDLPLLFGLSPGLTLLLGLSHVAGLVDLTALDRRGQGLRAVDDEEPRHRRVDPALDEIVNEGLDGRGVLMRPR